MLLNASATLLLDFIINNYFNDSRCVLFFSDQDLGYSGEIPKVLVKDLDLAFGNHGCQGIVIQTQKPVGLFREFEGRIRMSQERFNRRRYLIVLPERMQDDFFQLQELNFVSDVLLLVPMKEGVLLKTHKYVGEGDNREPVLLDRWFWDNSSFWKGACLFLDKISDQQGRALRMATFTYLPYSVVDSELSSDWYGSELTSALEYARKHNMTPVLVVNLMDEWGEVFPNWSGNGLLGNLAQDKADIGFSALYTWEYCYHYLDLSKPLVRTGITCLVPRPGLAAGWLTPLYSYSKEIWLFVFITFVSFFSVLFLGLKSYHKFSSSKLLELTLRLATKPLLQQSLTQFEISKEQNFRFLGSIVLVFSVFFTSSYSSGLASIMTVPRYDEVIDTVEQFADSGMDWGATQDAWVTSIQNAEEKNYKKIVGKFHATPKEVLREYSKAGRFAFSIERLPSENFAIGEYIERDVITRFHLMEQDFYWEQCVMMARKNSVLLPTLDLFILRVFQAGLVSKWQSTAVLLFMNTYSQNVVKFYKYHSGDEHVVTKLKLVHVQGAFGALILGYSLSFVAFVLERCRFLKLQLPWVE